MNLENDLVPKIKEFPVLILVLGSLLCTTTEVTAFTHLLSVKDNDA